MTIHPVSTYGEPLTPSERRSLAALNLSVSELRRWTLRCIDQTGARDGSAVGRFILTSLAS